MLEGFDRHAKHIDGMLSCFDRIVIMGSLLDISYAEGMAAHLSAHGIRIFDFTLLDNAFIALSNVEQVQRIANRFDVKRLHRKRDSYARKLCPVVNRFRSGVHWSIMQLSDTTGGWTIATGPVR